MAAATRSIFFLSPKFHATNFAISSLLCARNAHTLRGALGRLPVSMPSSPSLFSSILSRHTPGPGLMGVSALPAVPLARSLHLSPVLLKKKVKENKKKLEKLKKITSIKTAKAVKLAKEAKAKESQLKQEGGDALLHAAPPQTPPTTTPPTIVEGTPTTATQTVAPSSSNLFGNADWMKMLSSQTVTNEDVVDTTEDNSHFVVHVKATNNNTIIGVTHPDGRAINWASSGSSGFKGSKRSSTYAAQIAGENAAKVAYGKGVRSVRVVLKGLGQGRSTALKGLQVGGLKILSVTDATPVPHGGCRPRKARRL